MRYNISDFGAGASSGLLEMTLSKDSGVTARLGTGGTDCNRKRKTNGIPEQLQGKHDTRGAICAWHNAWT